MDGNIRLRHVHVEDNNNNNIICMAFKHLPHRFRKYSETQIVPIDASFNAYVFDKSKSYARVWACNV